MQFSIITPEKILVETDAQMITIPGTEGEFGVLDGHAPFISTIRPGVITIEEKNGSKRLIAIVSGIAEVVPEHCVVLAEIAEECSALSPADAQVRVEAAKTVLDNAITDVTRKDAEKKLALAQAVAMAA